MKNLVFLFSLCILQLSAQESLTEVKKHAFGNPFDPANQDAITLLNRLGAEQMYNLMLFEDWQAMDIEGKDGIMLHVDSANYHINQDKIFFVNQGKLYELFPEKINKATLNKRTFIYMLYEFQENKIKPRYFEVLEEGEYTLLRKYEIKKKVSNDHPMGIPAATEVEYYQDQKFYYLRDGARHPEILPAKRSDFIMIFRKNRPRIVGFAKENKTSLRSAEDLKAIFAFYNRLAAQS